MSSLYAPVITSRYAYSSMRGHTVIYREIGRYGYLRHVAYAYDGNADEWLIYTWRTRV